MKSYKILLFFFSLIVGLVLLTLCFPPEGIYINKVQLRFPSLSQVLGHSDEDDVQQEEEEITLTPEELMELRMAALHAARDSEFVASIEQNPARFFMPDDDITYFDSLFSSLERASSRPTRIMHYSDSQLEEDRMTGVLREWFQSTFSGNGPGLVPAVQTLGSATVSVSTYPELRNYMYFGPPELRASHRRYGPLAQMAEVDGSALFTVTVHGGSVYPHCCSFRRISVLMSGQGHLTVDGSETELTSPYDSTYQGLRICSALLPSSVSRVSIRAAGPMEVYGLMADGASGVSVDNIAMRGVSGTHFIGLDHSTFAPFFRQQHVSLIIMQYGGNALPYLKDEEDLSEYKHQLQSQIALFKRISPQSCILLIGPSDMAKAVGDEMRTYPLLPQLVDSLQAAALESGAAFWNMYRAMGGRGSMARWVRANPPLAGEDYVHFTPRGSRKMSELLCQTFQFYYEYYRFRNGLDQEEALEDTVFNDTTRKSLPSTPAAQ